MYKPNINIFHILFIITISLNASTAFASVVTLSWDAPITNTDGTALTDLKGYKVYYGTQSYNYDHVIEIGNTTKYTVSNLENGIVYYFATTAYNMSGNESDFSNEVSGEALSVFECSLIPDTLIMPRGGTLVFQATVNNHTDESATVVLVTQITRPDGTKTKFIIGPINNFFEPYQSKSWQLSQLIPLDAPLGIYTYYGYVENFGVGNYANCQFTFEVTP